MKKGLCHSFPQRGFAANQYQRFLSFFMIDNNVGIADDISPRCCDLHTGKCMGSL